MTTQYGKSLGFFDLNRENMYRLIYSYFENPAMYKVKDEGGYSMYVCKIRTLLRTNRYLIAMVVRDKNPVSHVYSLDYLKWSSFQTRELENVYDVGNGAQHVYTPKNSKEYMLEIELSSKSDGHSSYRFTNGMKAEITLLNNKKTYSPYVERGNVVQALETYNTIITFV